MTTPPHIPLPQASAQPILTIDLGAVTANYRALRALAPETEIGGVVKADGYGCGAVEVARALKDEGCNSFFVTNLEEGAALRAGEGLENAAIYLFNGCFNEDPKSIAYNGLIPVLNTLGELKTWSSLDGTPAYALHVDTGMNRQGLSPLEAEGLAGAATPTLVMSHLASADNAGAPLNAEQRRRFEKIAQGFPEARRSLANSAGLYLGGSYHFDLARPGIALYGGQPLEGKAVDLAPVAYLNAPILQVRTIEAGETVGYGATFKSNRKARIATLPLGYADGILRALTNKGFVWVAGQKVPIVGRISMDLITIDVTGLPEEKTAPGSYVEILGANITVDALGAAAGTFGYEILTGLGDRYKRQYVGPGANHG